MGVSRTLWVLHIDDPDDSRFVAALELLREGRSIGYQGVSLSLRANLLDCCAVSDWSSDGLTEERDRAQLLEIRHIIDELKAKRPDFAAIADDRSLSVALVEDYGNGVVELCRLENERAVGPAIRS